MRLLDLTVARRVPLVGRRDILKEAERRIGRGGLHLLYLEGGGGIGKTAVLEAILEQSLRGNRTESMAACCVASEVVDLNDAGAQTSEGMIRRIIEVLGRWSFEQTQEALTALEEARIAGDMRAARVQTDILQTTFLDEFADLTVDGIVLAFDTMEALDHEHDTFRRELNGSIPSLSTGDWLCQSFLPALEGNVVLLFAGRPGGLLRRLEAQRERNAHVLVHHVPMASLSAQDTEEYLMAVAQAEGKHGDGDAATRLWSCGEERGDVVHHLTGGRPILVSLVADMVANDWPLPAEFDGSLDEVLKQNHRSRQSAMERALMTRLLESASPIGETIRAMAWLRKGATPELLARVMDLKTRDGKWDVYTASAYLEQVAQLAMVRVRPGTRRVFLHDEIYVLMDQHVLRQASDEERERVYGAIRRYYQEKTRELEDRIERFPPALSENWARLRQAYVEEMHYCLYHNPAMGFAMYFWLAEEALGGRDPEMDMLLRSEFLRTLTMLKDQDQHVGHVPREAEIDAAVRWGMRALFLHDSADGALTIYDQVRRRWGRDAGRLRLPWAHLQLQQAIAQIMRAEADDWADARSLLESAEGTADELLASPPENTVVRAYRWQARIIKSLALNYRGYLDRQEGRYLDAVDAYQQSAMLQRRLGMTALVPTLTNLAYVMALIGESHHARLMAEEAERRARRSGKEHMLAMTLNVRALVEEHDDRHKAALRYTDRALEVAAKLPSPRVRGLIHLTRARAHRNLWDSLSETDRQREPAFFPNALKEANQAIKLLRNNPADRVNALLERGCIFRDLAHRQITSGRADEAAELATRSQDDLKRAAVLAGAIDMPRQQALAYTNMGWLHYYLGQASQVEEALGQACTPFPREYLFGTNGPLPSIAMNGSKGGARLPYWNTLGKVEMLKAYLDLDEAVGSPDRRRHEESLLDAAEHITLSLAYGELVADSHFDLNKAEKGLHQRLLQDNLSIRSMHCHAQRAAEQLGMEQPTRFQGLLNSMFGPSELWA